MEVAGVCTADLKDRFALVPLRARRDGVFRFHGVSSRGRAACAHSAAQTSFRRSPNKDSRKDRLLSEPTKSVFERADIAAKVAVAMSTIFAVQTAESLPASAACSGGDRFHQVSIFRGGDAFIFGRGTTTNVLAGRTERWCDLWEEEEYTPAPPFNFDPRPQVCGYNSHMVVYHPDGSYANRSHSNQFHAGCSYSGWGFHDPLDGVYAENKRFNSKWESDATSGIELIGTLVD